MEKSKKQILLEKIIIRSIIRLLGHSISLFILCFAIWLNIKIGNFWLLPLELLLILTISGVTEAYLLTDYEYIDEKIRKQVLKRINKQERMKKKQLKKEKTTQERVTAYSAYEEKQETLKETNNEIISDIEKNLESDDGRLISRKSEYVSLLDLVEKYKELERKKLELNNSDSIDNIGYSYMKK